jgi:hypothetical protein
MTRKIDPKAEALAQARLLSQTGRKHVVRESFGTYHVCPLYEPGSEGLTADAGYSSLGVLVKESL